MTKRKYRRHILEIIPLNFKLSTVFTTAPGHPTRLVGQRRHLKVVSPKSMAPCPNPPPGITGRRGKAHGRQPTCGGASDRQKFSQPLNGTRPSKSQKTGDASKINILWTRH